MLLLLVAHIYIIHIRTNISYGVGYKLVISSGKKGIGKKFIKEILNRKNFICRRKSLVKGIVRFFYLCSYMGLVFFLQNSSIKVAPSDVRLGRTL